MPTDAVHPTSARIKAFLVAHFPTAGSRTLTGATSLLENGILDSLGILDLVAYLEREFLITIADEDLLPEHFETLDRLTVFVEAKRKERT
jgi:acyl carrier protein